MAIQHLTWLPTPLTLAVFPFSPTNSVVPLFIIISSFWFPSDISPSLLYATICHPLFHIRD
jgi:hypothetical protein